MTINPPKDLETFSTFNEGVAEFTMPAPLYLAADRCSHFTVVTFRGIIIAVYRTLEDTLEKCFHIIKQ
jgi:hypothetical protein